SLLRPLPSSLPFPYTTLFRSPQLGEFLAENVAALIVSLAKGYSHILTPATSTGKNVMPRAAALLDVQQISDICAVESADTFVRPDRKSTRLNSSHQIISYAVF